MEAGFTLLALVILAILIIPLILAFSTNSKVNAILSELIKMKGELKGLKDKINETATSLQPIKEDLPIVREEIPIITTNEQTIEEVIKPPIEVPRETNHETSQELIEELPKDVSRETISETENIITSTHTEEPAFHNPLIKKSNWNLEQFIGEKLISIVGIAILVLGIFFTVKWAINRNLMSDGGKIIMGLLAGTILVALAHKLSKNYRAFSSILAGGAIAVFYFSVYEAFQAYHLIPQVGAFVAMIIITCFAVIMAVFYDKKELAIIAIVGGFLTPFLLSTGAGNYKVLFTYLLILNIGMFALAYFKRWTVINFLCYGFTLIIFGAWMVDDYPNVKAHSRNGFLFATLFFLVFFGMNLIYNLKNKMKFQPLDLGLLLSNSFSYFGVGLYFLHQFSGDKYQGLFTAGLALFNFAFAYSLYKRQQVDKNLKYFLIGLVLTFVSLIAPIQLDGNYITLFWSCEMVLLFWLGTKSGITLVKNGSILMMVLAIISLMLDWQNNYYSVHIYKLTPILNKAFITSVIVLSSLLLKKQLLQQDLEQTFLWGIIPKRYYENAIRLIVMVLIYTMGFLEVSYQINNRFHLASFSIMIQWMYHLLFISCLTWYCFRKNDVWIQRIAIILGFATLLVYPVTNQSITNFRNIHLQEQTHGSMYTYHYLIPVLALFILYQLVQHIRQNYEASSLKRHASAWLLTALLIFIVCAESVQMWTSFTYQIGFSLRDGFVKASKIAWPIIWSVTSLILMVWGMKEKIKHLRIISLSLFGLTVLKLFVYDISNVSDGGKIAAFIILGIILLLVAFLYQRIKGIFTDENLNENK